MQRPRHRAVPTWTRALVVCAAVGALAACGSTVQVEQGPAGTAVAPDGSLVAPADGALGVPTDGVVPDGGAGVPDPLDPGADGPGAGGPGTAGSGAGPDGSGGPAGGDGGPSEPTGGLTPGGVTTPVKVGILMPKKTNDAFLGTTPPSVQAVDVFRALVPAINAAGGLAGRRIDPVEAYFDAQAISYASEYQAACATLTEDERVEIVIDVSTVHLGFERCVAKAGIVHLHGGVQSTTEAQLGQLPGLFLTDAPSLDRIVRNGLAAALASGRLARGDTLGVMVESCAENVELYDRVLVPTMRSAGVEVVRADSRCVSGFGSASGASSDVSSAVLRFRSQSVDAVTFVSNYESVAVLFFSQAAGSQGFAPRYLLTSLSLASPFASSMPASQLPRMSIAGTSPVVDRADVEQTALDRRCSALASRGGLDVAPSDIGAVLVLQSACGVLSTAEAALRRTGGRTDLATLASALEGLGRLALPGSVGERNQFGRDRHDAPVSLQLTAYDQRCRCFEVAAAPRALD